MMKKAKDRKLLAYIQMEDVEQVFIDVVRLSRNGLSYHYMGDTWNRNLHPSSFGHFYCTDQRGRRWRICPLNRHYKPSWAEHIEVEIRPEARQRYDFWLSGSLRSRRDELCN